MKRRHSKHNATVAPRLRPRTDNKPIYKSAVGSDGVLELVMYDDIGENWWDGSGITAKNVKQTLDGAGNYSSILIRLNSPGGDAFEGIAIHNLLKSAGKPIEVCVDGIAASAASIIAMCGDTITMAANAMMMIHDAWTVCMGNSDDMLKTADTLEKIDGSIAQTYVTKTKKPLAEIKTMMDDESWMSAQECVDNGFATRIAPVDEPADNEALALARNFKTLARMKNVPEALRAEKKAAEPEENECECECSNCMDGDCESCSNPNCEDPNCEDCPMQAGDSNKVEPPKTESNLSLYEARAKMLLRRAA